MQNRFIDQQKTGLHHYATGPHLDLLNGTFKTFLPKTKNNYSLYFCLTTFESFHGKNLPGNGKETMKYLAFEMQHSVYISANCCCRTNRIQMQNRHTIYNIKHRKAANPFVSGAITSKYDQFSVDCLIH